jgi:hypothetical protein
MYYEVFNKIGTKMVGNKIVSGFKNVATILHKNIFKNSKYKFVKNLLETVNKILPNPATSYINSALDYADSVASTIHKNEKSRRKANNRINRAIIPSKDIDNIIQSEKIMNKPSYEQDVDKYRDIKNHLYKNMDIYGDAY